MIINTTSVKAPFKPKIPKIGFGNQESWGSRWYNDSTNWIRWELHSIVNAAQIIENPHYDSVNNTPTVLKAQIGYNSDYTGLAGNSRPRCEIYPYYDFLPLSGDTMICKFKIYLPKNYQFDVPNWNPCSFFQIFQTFQFGINGNYY